ncbi:TonB-dependent receptor [Flavobacteriaceae bacterium Ap0902]|nr:TonB-dependent receptor [Flavobacteriaceae bacterium Ap0902]
MKFFKYLLLFLGIISYSQTYTGQVIDENNLPIAYAEVSTKDSIEDKVLQSTWSDNNGFFSIQVESEKSFYIEINYLGYEVKKLYPDIADLGTIQLKPSSIALNNVIVEGKKKLIEQKVDRLVFNVENSVAATGGDGLDILRLTPRIRVQNDEISMTGKGSIMVLINDRIVPMSGIDLTTYLKTIAAENIQSIEVISNPPAKYSAEGNSGLVNIILKKYKNYIWNASIRSIYRKATFSKINEGVSFNIKRSRLKFYTAISYTKGSSVPKEMSKIFYPNQTWHEVINRRNFSNAFSGRIGLDYKINDYISNGLIYNYITNKPTIKEIDNTFLTNNLNNGYDFLISTIGTNKYVKKLNNFNYHIAYDMDNLSRRLSLDINYFNYKNKRNRFFSTQSFSPINQPIPNSLEEARNYGIQDIQNYSINIDMEHPNVWSELTYGVKLSLTETDNVFKYFDIVRNSETLNPSFSNHFVYKENTQALYISCQKKIFSKLNAKLGLRYELTQTEGFSSTLNQINTIEYSKIFPTFYIGYIHNDNHSLSLNYGRRISRPNFKYLNPFRFVNNPYSYSEGNPFLQPAFTDNIEFEYTFKDNLITNIYYSYTDNEFEQVTIIDANSKVKQVIPLNFIVNKMFGITQNIVIRPVRWWVLNASADVYYSDTSSKIPETLEHLSGWGGELSISNDLTLNNDKTLFLNTNLWLLTRGVDYLDYNSDDLQLNASVKWLLLNKRLIFSLNFQDLINPRGTKYTTYSNQMKNSFINYYDEQYFSIGILYNIGKKMNLEKRNIRNKEEKNRTE